MIRVLCVLSNLRNNNGVASCMMNYCNQDEDIEIDYFCLEKTNSSYEIQLKAKGSSIFFLPDQKNMKSTVNKEYVKSVLANGDYDILHVNIIYYWALMFLIYSKKYGIKKRVLHCHNPKLLNSRQNKRRTLQFTWLCNCFATHYLACSNAAGKSVFGKREFETLRNAIDTEKFGFSQVDRECYRKMLNVENKFVVGTSCRHTEQKNPFFIIDVFEKIVEKNKDAILLWVGYGPLKEKVEKYASDKGLIEKVLMLGNRDDMNKLYSAMDVFILPSLFEGLGMVFIEAQANGLFCFASDRVYEETNVTGNIMYLPIDKGTQIWADKILTVCYPERELSYVAQIREKHYDMHCEKNALFDYYKRIAVSIR